MSLRSHCTFATVGLTTEGRALCGSPIAKSRRLFLSGAAAPRTRYTAQAEANSCLQRKLIASPTSPRLHLPSFHTAPPMWLTRTAPRP